MKKILTLCLGAAVLLAGCAKEIDSPKATIGKTVITVSTPQTKTSFGELDGTKRPVYWASGDKIAVNGVTSAAVPADAVGTASAEFTFEGVLETPYKIVYPSTIWKDASTITLPAVATSGVVPLIGYSADNANADLTAGTAVVKISVKAAAATPAAAPDTDPLSYIQISADNRLSGDFSVDFESGALTPAASPADKDKSVTVSTSVTLGDTPVEYYIPVPAGTYSFTVKIADKAGHFMEKTTTSAKTLVAGQISAFPVIEFVPTGTQIDAEIHNAAELIAFAKDWNSEKWPVSAIAKVVEDIVFDETSSAEFNATGGIGNIISDDNTNYFNGDFDGGDHTISGLAASVPLFAYTGSAGIVHNVKIAQSTTLTVPAGANGQFGMIVGRHKGALKNCESAGKLVIQNIDAEDTQYYGGLVGRSAGGSIENCSMTGEVSYTGDATANSGFTAYIGGLTGTVESGASVKTSKFGGKIFIGDPSSSEAGPNMAGKYLNIGGISGSIHSEAKSEISGCETLEGATIKLQGVMKSRIGGIVGYANDADSKVSDCVNRAPLSFASSGARADTTPISIGGIVGDSVSDITGCTNYGSISSLCNSTTVGLGGIVSTAFCNVKDCINEETGTITRTCQTAGTQSNRYNAFGGIVAQLKNESGSMLVENCENKAAITHNLPGTQALTSQCLGGIVGKNDYSGSLIVKGCKNSGKLYAEDKTNKTKFYLTAIGGILGCCKGQVTIEDSHNTAEINCSYTKGGTNNRNSHVGGIAGIIAKFDAPNNPQVNGESTPSGITNPVGIAGISITGCSSTGLIHNQNYNNTLTMVGGPVGGGIVGTVIGTDDSKAKISDCTASPSPMVELRGYLGGIAGYIQDVNMTNCIMDGNSTTSNPNSTYLAGLAAWVIASSIEKCTVKGSTLAGPKNVAGFVGILDATSSIIGCKAEGVTLTSGTHDAALDAAVFVSNAEAGAKITDCGASGTLDGDAISMDSRFITTDAGAVVSGTYIIE